MVEELASVLSNAILDDSMRLADSHPFQLNSLRPKSRSVQILDTPTRPELNESSKKCKDTNYTLYCTSIVVKLYVSYSMAIPTALFSVNP